MLLIKEAAQKLKCSTRTIQSYISSGKIKAVKIGNKWQISEEEIQYILRNGLRQKTNN